MAPNRCAFCGRRIPRDVRGRPASDHQLSLATAYHQPDPIKGDWVCNTHHVHPPSSSATSTSSSRKRQRDESPTTSDDLTVPSSDTPLPSTPDDEFDHPEEPTTPYLVHPFEQALLKSKQAWPITTPFTTPEIKTDDRQWKVQWDNLHHTVLLPSNRISHMHRVGTPSEAKIHDHISMTGRYLRVWDISIDEDTGTNLVDDLIQSVTSDTSTSSHSSTPTSTSSHPSARSSTSSTDPSQLLKKALPFSLTTHEQESYCQTDVTTSTTKDPPVYRTSKVRQMDSYARLVQASKTMASLHQQPDTISDYKSDPKHHLFTPSINIKSIHSQNIQQHLMTIIATAQQLYKQHTPRQHLELECDHVFTPPLDGFGIEGAQLYFKHGLSVTWLHDEIMWCSALNYMTKESIGCALWIAVGLNDLKQTLSIMEIDELFQRKPILKVGTLLDTLIKSGAYIEFAFQKPGQMISSPPGNGAAHIVISEGPLLTQLAWNSTFTIPGLMDCLSFWGERDRSFGHISPSNGSMATQVVVPLFTMELNGYPLGLKDKIAAYQLMIAQLQQAHPENTYSIEEHPATQISHCDRCLHRQDWIRLNDQCIHCYFDQEE
jgi:hypothetical protein